MYVPIAKWHTHPNAFDFKYKKKYGEWRRGVLYWDYSLLQLKKRVTFTVHIQPACLPSFPDQDYSGDDAYASGWGKTEKDLALGRADLSDVPKTAKLQVVSPDTCKGNFRESMCEQHCRKESVICTYGKKDVNFEDEKYVEDACQGDSGGIFSC